MNNTKILLYIPPPNRANRWFLDSYLFALHSVLCARSVRAVRSVRLGEILANLGIELVKEKGQTESNRVGRYLGNLGLEPKRNRAMGRCFVRRNAAKGFPHTQQQGGGRTRDLGVSAVSAGEIRVW